MADPTTAPPSTPPQPALTSRLRGALYGLAVTDALGGPLEFQPRRHSPSTHLRTMIANSNFDIPAGAWTDDTSMALCLAESLQTTYPSFSAGDVAARWVKWMDSGYLSSVVGSCFDIGNTTLTALSMWSECLRDLTPGTGAYDAAVKEAQRRVEAELMKDSACGNGSLMRTLPVALLYSADIETAIAISGAASAVTHPHVTNTRACQLYAALVIQALQGVGKEVLCGIVAQSTLTLGTVYREKFSGLSTPEDWEKREERTISSSGFVVNTLDAALWGFFSTDSFEEGAVAVVNLGGDADTVGAVYGGLAGAYYGIEEIPDEWLSALISQEVLMGVIDPFVAKAVEVAEASTAISGPS